MKSQQYHTNKRVYRITEHGDVYREDGVQLYPCRGYLGSVSFLLGGKRVTIAPIVLELFVGQKPSHRHVAMHKNMCSWNNHYSNLSWGTHTERNLQGTQNKGMRNFLPDEPKTAKGSDPRRKPVTVNGSWYISVSDASAQLGVRADCISRAARSGIPYKGKTFGYK